MMMRGYRNYHIAKWLLVVILLTTILILSICACGTAPSTTTLVPITFHNVSIEDVIREAIDQPEGPIYTSDLEPLTKLLVLWKGVSDLTGLEYCLNLEELYLYANNISDISALVPDLDYSDLEINNGDMASIAYTEMKQPETELRRRKFLGKSLLKYY